MELVIFCVLAYLVIGAAILLREVALYPDATGDRQELIGAVIVCIVLWPFFVVWCLREWWAERNG